MAAKSKSAKYYAANPAARAVKDEKSAEVNRRPEQIQKRVESNAKRREAKAAGKNISGKDYDHAVGGFVKSSTNRGRAEKSRVKGSKRS